jgi:hypothetical protein
MGCASLGLGLARALPDQRRECPGVVVPTQQIEGEFLSRQRVRVQAEGLDWRLTLVIQKRGDTLILVGLDAFGAKEFVLTQSGSDVVVERPRGRLPLSPTDLLRDLHRTRFARGGSESEDGVTLQRSADGAVTIQHARCGYTTTWIAFDETPLAAPAGPDP